MSAELKTRFHVDISKCIGCGRCVNVCTGMVLKMSDGMPVMQPYEKFGWSGCWRCQHCIAVCPEGAISIFGKKTSDLPSKPDNIIAEQLERLVSYRRSCRRYLMKNVAPSIIDRIMDAMQQVPSGGNAQQVEYTVIDDMNRLEEIWDIAYARMEENAKRGYYSSGFSSRLYQTMTRSENSLRKDDMLFCGAPHLFVAHQKASGKWVSDAIADCNIATAYFELLCNAHGLGTVIMSYAASVLQDVPQARAMLGIPEDHYMNLIVGFGYPEIPYARGVKKDRFSKIHRWSKR